MWCGTGMMTTKTLLCILVWLLQCLSPSQSADQLAKSIDENSLDGSFLKYGNHYRGKRQAGDSIDALTSLAACRGTPLVLEAPSGWLTSPNYPKEYPNDATCTWQVKAKSKCIIRVEIEDMYMRSGGNCPYESLRLFDGGVSDKALGVFCGRYRGKIIYYTTGPQLTIQLTTGSHGRKYRGFKLFYVTDCNPAKPTASAPLTACPATPLVLEAPSGWLTSPNYPEEYPSDATCTWQLNAKGKCKIRVVIEDMYMRSGGKCRIESLRLFDGGVSDEALGVFCGRYRGKIIYYTKGPRLTVQLTTGSHRRKYRGFKLFYMTECVPAKPTGCGKQIVPDMSPKVVGGTDATPHSFPWVVQMRVLHPGFGDMPWCGAALLNKDWVVTATHCTTFRDNLLNFIDLTLPEHLHRVTFVTGEHNVSQIEGTETRHKASLVISHPDFNGATYRNDLTLFKLQKPATFGRNVQPICLPSTSIKAGENVTIAGWGQTEPPADDPRGRSLSLVLMKGYITTFDTETCNKKDILDGRVQEGMFCAGTLDGSIDSCLGDSGGPLFAKDDLDVFHLHGLVSWGIGCAQANKPGVYTDVVFYRDWIQEQMDKN